MSVLCSGIRQMLNHHGLQASLPQKRPVTMPQVTLPLTDMCTCDSRTTTSIMHYKKCLYITKTRTEEQRITKMLAAMERKIHYIPGPTSIILITCPITYFLLVMIFVMACRIMTPAFSVSFFVSPLVTQTLRAGTGCQPASLGLTPRPRGKALSRVMRTPFARHCGR